MIEKFSDEELKQIKKELGLFDCDRKTRVFGTELQKLSETWENKPFARCSHVLNVIDITLNNVKCFDRRNQSTYRLNVNVEQDLTDEYRQMFQEILEIIKKHNREWNGSGLA